MFYKKIYKIKTNIKTLDIIYNKKTLDWEGVKPLSDVFVFFSIMEIAKASSYGLICCSG